MTESASQWHDWAFCPCCGFDREVLIVQIGDLIEIECTTCGFAWADEPEPDSE